MGAGHRLLAQLILFTSITIAQIPISVGSTPSSITFTGFTGVGFAPLPSAGQLDSDDWRIQGMSDGNTTWGGEHTIGDFARGSSSGGVTTGGIYAFDVASGNIGLGIQPGGEDMTPGRLILRLQNNETDPITQLDISYSVLEFNDQGRANSLNFAHSEGLTEPSSFTAVSSLNYTTTEVASVSPTWATASRSTTISEINVAQNEYIYLVWETDDVSGSGSRDEIAIDNISFNNILPVELTSFSATTIGSTIKLSWNTATEINNYGFDVERKSNVKGQTSDSWEKIGFVEGSGNSNSPKNYSFVDNKVSNDKYSYRLKQIDSDGQFEYSKIIYVDFNGVKKFELSQNYPNPFNPTTTIRFNLPEAGNVKLTLFNILGQEIITLVNEYKESGVHTINFDASNLNSGMYIYKIESGSFVQTRKMTLVK